MVAFDKGQCLFNGGQYLDYMCGSSLIKASTSDMSVATSEKSPVPGPCMWYHSDKGQYVDYSVETF